MEKLKPRSRRHSPKSRSGCQTCRIRRVKCGEELPSCVRCTSTGRKCDGYPDSKQVIISRAREAVKIPTLSRSYSIPFSIPGSQRDRQLLHFYCAQSAVDLGGSLNHDLWYNFVLQQAQNHAVVRKAVIAFGSIHWHALSLTQNDVLEHIKQYNVAIRSFRKYLSLDSPPDPHVVLLCTALFFNCENGMGEPDKAVQHLENGLRYLKTVISQRPNYSALTGYQLTGGLVDPSIIQMFSRLDFQTSVYANDRTPVLPLMQDFETPSQEFRSIQDVQNSLVILMSRSYRFIEIAQQSRFCPEDDIPTWIRDEKRNLQMQFELWKQKLLAFAVETPGKSGSSSDNASHIQVFKIHHQLFRMALHSFYPHKPEVFTRNPNPEAEDILDMCDNMIQSLLAARDKAIKDSGIWKFTLQMGILHPLVILAVKGNRSIRQRAMNQVKLLSGYREGLLDAKLAHQMLAAMQTQAEAGAASTVEGNAFHEGELSTSPCDSSLTAAIDALDGLSLEDTCSAILDERGGFSQWAKLVGVTQTASESVSPAQLRGFESGNSKTNADFREKDEDYEAQRRHQKDCKDFLDRRETERLEKN